MSQLVLIKRLEANSVKIPSGYYGEVVFSTNYGIAPVTIRSNIIFPYKSQAISWATHFNPKSYMRN